MIKNITMLFFAFSTQLVSAQDAPEFKMDHIGTLNGIHEYTFSSKGGDKSLYYWVVFENSLGELWPQLSGDIGKMPPLGRKGRISVQGGKPSYPARIFLAGYTEVEYQKLKVQIKNGVYYLVDRGESISLFSQYCAATESGLIDKCDLDF